MILVIGEILHDVFPDGKRLGGAPFNFAYHLQNLGLPVRFITRVGNDKAFMKYMRKEFEVDIIALTKGAAGSELLGGQQHVTFVGEKSRHVVDTVGAGDAFTAMLAIGYLHGWAFGRILKLASEFSAQICELKGAIPSQNSFYIPFRKRIARQGEHVR